MADDAGFYQKRLADVFCHRVVAQQKGLQSAVQKGTEIPQHDKG